MKNLTTTIGNSKVILSHVKDNTFKLIAESGIFTNGKGAAYSDGSAIKQSEISGNELILTKAQIERSGTYMVYLDSVRVNFFQNWSSEDNRKVSIISASDLYYYFRRPDAKYTQKLYK